MSYKILVCLAFFSFSFINYHQDEKKIKDLVPTSRELAGFNIIEPPSYYNRTSLWDYINGGAPGYISYGFVELATFIVNEPKDSLEIVVDIYDMGDSLNAFGIFSSERSPGKLQNKIGSGSFCSQLTFYFWQHQYYIKLMAYDITPETGKNLSRIAEIISNKIPELGTTPFIFSAFPEQDRIEGSLKFIPKDVLGQHYFMNGYSIEYQQEKNNYQIYLIDNADSLNAQDNFQSYFNYLKNEDLPAKDNNKIVEQTFLGKDSYYGNILVRVDGDYIICVMGYEDLKNANDISKKMFEKL